MTKEEAVLGKIVGLPELKARAEGWRLKGQKIVFTNGCFDILHKGHIRLILQAAQLGNKLIVAINTDASVKKLKGTNRPINVETDRALLVAAQLFVDAVIYFEEETPLSLIESIQPDVLVKGGDYTIETVIGSDFIQKNGGEVVIIPTVAGYSSTHIIEEMK